MNARLQERRALNGVRRGLARATRGLRSKEELFEALAAHTPVGLFISNAEGKAVYVNQRWCDLTGLTPEEAMGDGWSAALHPEDAARVGPEWEQAAAAGRDSVVEYRFVRPDGTVSWIEGYAAALHDEDGLVIGWVGTCLDFTARKEAEERFRRTFDDAPVGMAFVSPEGRWLQANPALCRMLGYTEDKLTRLTVADVTHPDDVSSSIDRIRSHLSGEIDTVQTEKRYVRADGEIVWVALTSTLTRDAEGQPLHFVAQMEDVTDRVLAQRALEEAEERFRRAFDDAPIGMALAGLDGRWLQVNETLCQITGYSEAELLERTFMDITHPDDLDVHGPMLGNVVDGGSRAVRFEKRYIRRDGRTVWVNISTSLVHDADGQPLHFVSQIEDVTERRRAERRLKELADHDSLTGLLNRRRFDEELQLTLLRLRRHGGRAALLLLDLDEFKLVNDTHGHKCGDEVLGAVARALRSRLRATDVVARLGGDEFAAIVLEVDADAAQLVASDVVATVVAKPAVWRGTEIRVTASVGVVLLDRVMVEDQDDVLVAADRALYEAKAAGRNRISLG
ncbi:MAG TPA: PAS domain S-box protein [Gaiellaceae bacterium]|nr:PAS domain S-box protein [Gaiellaceae bacterium]